MTKVLNNLDLAKNQLLNAVVQNLATAPSEPKAGQFYYDTTDNQLKVYSESDWIGLRVQTASELVALINAGSTKISKDKVAGLTEAIDNASMTGEAIVDAINSDTASKTISLEKVTGLSSKLSTIESNTNTALSAEQKAKRYTDQKIAELVGSASEEFNTFKELEDFLKSNQQSLQAISNVTKKFKQSFGDGTAKEFTIEHNLNTQDVVVSIRETNSPYEIVYADVKVTNANSIVINTGIHVPTSNQYTVVIVG